MTNRPSINVGIKQESWDLTSSEEPITVFFSDFGVVHQRSEEQGGFHSAVLS